jgi:hypothetical protein
MTQPKVLASTIPMEQNLRVGTASQVSHAKACAFMRNARTDIQPKHGRVHPQLYQQLPDSQLPIQTDFPQLSQKSEEWFALSMQ